MLTALIASDITPLNILGMPERTAAAVAFMQACDACESIEALNQRDEYPPYYWNYRRKIHRLSENLTQFALNDYMAVG